MKKILIILCLFLLVGCNNTNNSEYYRKVSDTIVSFYKDSKYNKDDFRKDDINSIDKYLNKLTHENEEINITNYINDSTTVTSEKDTDGIYEKNNNWYIKYKDLDFINSSDIEPYAVINCNGKTFTLFKSLFYPSYEETKNNKVYSYVYVGSKTLSNNRKYAYRSSYDGSGLIVNIDIDSNKIINIDTNFENVNDFNSNNNSNNGLLIRVVMIIIILVVSIFSVYKLMTSYKND